MLAHVNDAPLTMAFLSQAYRQKTLHPRDVAHEVFRRIERDRNRLGAVWLYIEPRERVEAVAEGLDERREAGEALPLFGVPFAVKDNIDVAGVPTTAGCTALSTVPVEHARVVARLIDAGAIFVGKTNLDQLATGLVGVRSLFGIPTNPFDDRVIPGGSSSGSAVAVAAGQVSFALGTDTAGSGRVPAALNNVVGLKPSRGLLSTSGVVPACRSLDCVSVFALSVEDACAVAEVARAFDASDPYSRPDADRVSFVPGRLPAAFRFGVPRQSDLVFFGDTEARRCFGAAVRQLARKGGEPAEIDFGPFREAGHLLYEGPWVAERLAVGQELLAQHPEALLPVIREILTEAMGVDAIAAFRGMYRLEELRRRASRTWDAVDFLVVPTVPTIYTVAEVLEEPRRLNAQLGVYTNFVNLLDFAALAVPAGFRRDGLPTGITLIGPHASDGTLAAVGSAYHRSLDLPLGATGQKDEAASEISPQRDRPARGLEGVLLAVVGPHVSGLLLNRQLREAGATLVRTCRTERAYSLFALPETTPPNAGMIRALHRETGAAIEVEVWTMAVEAFGGFVARVPAPFCVGTVSLEDGTSVHGLLCEPHATRGAKDISRHGGWRAYLEAEK